MKYILQVCITDKGRLYMQKKVVASKPKKAEAVGFNLKGLVFEILIMMGCLAAGVILKRLINPFANMITDALHVPGGISTAFSLMFLVLASGVTTRKWSATAMGAMQAAVALSIGMVGSMGLLLPVSYVVPGIVIDIVMLAMLRGDISIRVKAFVANIAGSVAAAIFAEIAVFHLPLKALAVYLCLATLSGAICGYLAGIMIESINDIKNNKSGDGVENEGE